MNTREILADATGAGSSSVVKVSSNNPCTFNIKGTLGSDVVDIQYTPDDGVTWIDSSKDGFQVQLSALNTQVTIYGPGNFRANKGITSAAVGVSTTTEQGAA